MTYFLSVLLRNAVGDLVVEGHREAVDAGLGAQGLLPNVAINRTSPLLQPLDESVQHEHVDKRGTGAGEGAGVGEAEASAGAAVLHRGTSPADGGSGDAVAGDPRGGDRAGRDGVGPPFLGFVRATTERIAEHFGVPPGELDRPIPERRAAPRVRACQWYEVSLTLGTRRAIDRRTGRSRVREFGGALVRRVSVEQAVRHFAAGWLIVLDEAWIAAGVAS